MTCGLLPHDRNRRVWLISHKWAASCWNVLFSSIILIRRWYGFLYEKKISRMFDNKWCDLDKAGQCPFSSWSPFLWYLLMHSSVVSNYKWKECDRNCVAFSEKFCQTSSRGQVWDVSICAHTCVCVCGVCVCAWRWLVMLPVFACLVSAEWGRLISNCKCQVWLA